MVNINVPFSKEKQFVECSLKIKIKDWLFAFRS